MLNSLCILICKGEDEFYDATGPDPDPGPEPGPEPEPDPEPEPEGRPEYVEGIYLSFILP